MFKNYKVIKEQKLDDINSLGTLLVHEKTGARILLISNDDENKAFCIGFRTPPYDDTGLPHILEHSVLCGSKKFPVKEPFVELMKSSLNTFLNAMTFPDKTVYPVASCNDQDFANLMEVYMDAVLYPNIYTKPEIFQQEGWHYELENVNADLTYNGVVYNEMKGAFSSPDGILQRESLNALFPDTPYGVESGGNPDSIPTLTYEDFIAFHNKYYHPSNSYIILYGNCNMDERLTWLDKEYLSKFEKNDVDSSLKVQPAFEEPRLKVVEYPVTKEQGTNNKTYISYNVALPNTITVPEAFALDIITQVLLGAAGAPLERKLLDEQIGNVITGSFESEILQPVFSVSTKDANPEDKDRFVKVIEESLKQYCEEKLNRKALQAAINKYEFKLREADFGGASKGLIYGLNAFNKWLYDDLDVFSSFELTNIFNELKEKLNTNYYEELIQKYILNNTHKAVVICKPSLDVQERKEAYLKQQLAEYKNKLTEEEKEKIVEATKHLKAYQAAEDTKEDLATIPLLKKEDLSLDIIPLSNTEYKINDVTLLHHDYPTNGIAYIRFAFNLLNLPKKYLPYIGIYKSLLGNLDTAQHDYQTLEQDIDINTGGIYTSITTISNTEKAFMNLMIQANALYNKQEFVLDIIDEIIHTTKFNMKNRIKEKLAMDNAQMQQSLVGRGHMHAVNRAISYFDQNAYLGEFVDGIDYFDLINNILKDYDNKFDELVSFLEEMTNYIFTKENLIISFTGNNEGLEIFKNNLPNFINKLKPTASIKEQFVFEPKQLNEGFKAPYDVQYCALAGNFVKEGLKYTGALQVFSNAISTDYLWKNVRVLGGAYGCMCGFKQTGNSYFVSYRDPNLTKTYDVYKGILDYLDNFNADEDEMTKYIIGAVGTYDFPKSPSVKGLRSFNAYLIGLKDENYKQEKMEIVNATEQDIKNVKPYIEAILKQNNICVLGNINKIEEAKDYFKEVKMLLK